MKLSEFRRACHEEFGANYANILLRDHWITQLHSTANDALQNGVPARKVWEALCAELDIPPERRHGRGLSDPHP